MSVQFLPGMRLMWIWGLLLISSLSMAQRPMEKLDRSLVVQERDAGGVYITWRMLGTDPRNVSFNLYRNDQKINASPMTGATNYTDAAGSFSAKYSLETVWPDRENEWTDKTIKFPLSNVSGRARIPIKRIALDPPTDNGYTYVGGSMSVGDFTGDGQYELLLEWQSNVGHSSILEAMDFDGNSLWRINMGPNSDARKINFMVYDLNMDGRAEVACMTGPGTIDGAGNYINKGPAADYDPHMVIERGYGDNLMDDPKFISVFDGETGVEMATTDFWPPIGPRSTHEAIWGDDRGHRASSLKGGVLYTVEHGPILAFQRGVYTRVAISGYKWDGANGLERIWEFDSYDGHREYNYQANHSVSIGDVDGDGNDEYLTGPACFNSDGTPRWTTGWGHGDANHLSDHIPDRPGLEFFQPHEDDKHGMSMVDANTGEIIWSYYSTGDVGRAWAADVDPRFRGSEVKAIGWPLYNAMGEEIAADYNAYNQPLYFDGTVNRAMRNQSNIESYAHGRILTGWHYGVETNHSTKHDACLIADIMGDWREEMIFRVNYNQELVIFSSWLPTQRKNPTLMHDPTYRMNVAVQNVGYNQPAHVGYYFADGYPDHDIYMLEKDLGVITYGNFFIESAHSDLALSIDGGVVQQELTESAAQAFRLTREEDLGFKIYSYGADRYLGFTNAAEGDLLEPVEEEQARLFSLKRVEGAEEELYYLQSVDQPDLVVGITGASLEADAGMELSIKEELAHQFFRFSNAGSRFDCSGVWEGDAWVDNTGLCVDGQTGRYGNSADLETAYYRIKSLETGKYLSNGGLSGLIGVDFAEEDEQIWEVINEGKGFRIAAKDPVRYMHFISDGVYVVPNSNLGANIRVEEVSGTNSHYILTTIDGSRVLTFTDAPEDELQTFRTFEREELEEQVFVLEKYDLDLNDCNGEWKGGAWEDDCGRCVGGNTGYFPCVELEQERYRIKAEHSGLFLQPSGVSVVQNSGITSDVQIWHFAAQEDGSYYIQSGSNDQYIGVSSVAEGQNLRLSSNPTPFYVQGPIGTAGSYWIAPVAEPDLAFDVQDLSTNPGARILLWWYLEAGNQRFVLEPDLTSSTSALSLSSNRGHIYPNPVGEILQVHLNSPTQEGLVYRVLGFSGNEYLKGVVSGNTLELPVQSLVSGMYLLQIEGADFVETFKFVKE